MASATRVEYRIKTQWDETTIDHADVVICLEPSDRDVLMTVTAPFFNNPPNPGGDAGQPFPQLWDHEVVEAFFANDKKQYLEVELCPHGQHLLLLLNGVRNMIKDELSLRCTAVIDGDKWTGTATIPRDYFPPSVSKFNAYAIHGSDDERMYEALYPTPKGTYSTPDFHRLDYFQDIDFEPILPGNRNGQMSQVWTTALSN